MKKYILILTVVSLISACGQQNSTAEKKFKTLKSDVISGHDEMMGDMGTISNLIAKLNPKIDSTETGQKYKQASDQLKKAHDAMMEWMHQFSEAFPDINNDKKQYTDAEWEARTTRLKEQQKNLTKVGRLVDQSISNAQSLLK